MSGGLFLSLSLSSLFQLAASPFALSASLLSEIQSVRPRPSRFSPLCRFARQLFRQRPIPRDGSRPGPIRNDNWHTRFPESEAKADYAAIIAPDPLHNNPRACSLPLQAVDTSQTVLFFIYIFLFLFLEREVAKRWSDR